MRFFLDENFPKKAAAILKTRGQEVFDIRGTSQEGAPDVSIFQLAQKKAAVFLTTDKDFFHTVPLQFPEHYGIIVVALSRPNSRSILAKLEIVLEGLTVPGIRSKCVMLTDSRLYSILSTNPGKG